LSPGHIGETSCRQTFVSISSSPCIWTSTHNHNSSLKRKNAPRSAASERSQRSPKFVASHYSIPEQVFIVYF
jgi:hypothetical protein